MDDDQLKKVLIVDDADEIHLLIKLIFKNHTNIKLYQAMNGKEALKLIDRSKMDLIIMDMYMPEMDGISTVLKIRETEKKHNSIKTPIITLSAVSSKSEKQKALDAGSQIVIEKPFDRTVLLKSVLKLMKSPDHYSTK